MATKAARENFHKPVANDFFRFKQFLVRQDLCAMKVCTDSCLFGAYVPAEEAASVLDIGTGTGLLALMVAQRSPAQVTAVEIDPQAARQAAENVAASSWADRIQVHSQSLQDFARTNQTTYDLILSNPPFFEASLRSPVAARTMARHTAGLHWEEILTFGEQFLRPGGSLWIMLPPVESASLAQLAQDRGWHLSHRLQVFTREGNGGKYIRWVQQFLREQGPYIERQIAIRTSSGEYTTEFVSYLKAYYLYL
jgi:tRNA1Val (adenine37-N6)-methyltransferase